MQTSHSPYWAGVSARLQEFRKDFKANALASLPVTVTAITVSCDRLQAGLPFDVVAASTGFHDPALARFLVKRSVLIACPTVSIPG